jgi:hypothetical protein
MSHACASCQCCPDDGQCCAPSSQHTTKSKDAIQISPSDVKQESDAVPQNRRGGLASAPAIETFPLPCTIGELSEFIYDVRHPDEAEGGDL